MQSHLDSSVLRIRRMGMVVGECLSSRMDINGTKLKFEVLLMGFESVFNVLLLFYCFIDKNFNWNFDRKYYMN